MTIELYKSPKLKLLGYVLAGIAFIVSGYLVYVANTTVDLVMALATLCLAIYFIYFSRKLAQPHPFYIIDNKGIKRLLLWGGDNRYDEIAWQDVQIIMKQTMQQEHTYSVARVKMITGKRIDLPLDFLQRQVGNTKVIIHGDEAYQYFDRAFKKYRSRNVKKQ